MGNLFSTREERIRVSLADEWCQIQPGHANSNKNLTPCVGNQDRGKLLVNSFQQNICAVLVKILYTPCSCSDVLSQSSGSACYLPNKSKLLRLPPVRGPAWATSTAFCFSSCQSAAGIPTPHSSVDWDFAPGWHPGAPISVLSGEESSGKQLFPVDSSLKDRHIFELHISLCHQSLQRKNWNDQKVIPLFSAWPWASNTLPPHQSFASLEPSHSLTSSILLKGEICWF